ncbi:Piezo non-specific cation channel, R-Ras-binding domain [Phytophthora cactorum]|nr:Piezo non-specific cation channel, R-Ras-binding domain [Phytophthora cactorum]
MRRPTASFHSQPGVGPSSSFIGADGRILLTPTRPQDAGAAYGQVATPSFGSFHRDQSQHMNASGLQSTRSGRRRPGHKLSLRALAALRMAAEVLFASCLMVAVGARASLVSLYYLLVFCYGVVQSFQSRAITLLTLAVAAMACVCHGALKGIHGDDASYAGADVARLFGFRPMNNSTEYLQGSDAIHYWYVLKRLNSRSKEQEEEERAQQHFDLFEMGERLMNGKEPKRDRSRSMLRAVELFSAVFLLLTSVSVPAFASGLLYLVLLVRLIGYTVFVRRMTVQELLSRKSGVKFSSYFLGPEVTKLVLALCLVIIVAWYCFQLDQLADDDSAQTIANYLGFANFRDGGVRWQYFFFAGFLFLLFVSCAKLHNLHTEAKDTEASGTASLASGFSHNGATAVDLGAVNADVAQSLLDQRSRTATTDIKELLSKQSIVVRAFARDGGLLLGSAAAIVWCVSYPSYLSAPFLGLAFVTIALFGVLSSSLFMWLLIAYGTLLALAEYTSNLTIDFLSDDYTTYGLRGFDYPFLDIGAHTLCLVFMFLAIRTQWRYQDVLRESRQRRNTAKVTGVEDENHDDDIEVDRASFANFVRLAKMRSQMQQGWRSAARLWLVDAKRVVFTHLDALVLATILIVALSTHVSFLQIGYLVLAALLMLFFEKRRRFWRVLLLYALGACFAVFIRNIDCTESSEMELIGLQCYHPGLYTWGSLWPTLFSAQLLIIFQLVFQLVIYVANSEAIEERMRTKEHVRQNPVFFVSRLAVEVDNWFRICGVLLCYTAFIVVALQYESGPTTLSTNMVGALQLALFLVIFGNHLGGFQSAPRTSLRLKLLWSLALLIEVLILVARYVYQFEEVSTYLEEHLFTSSFISAEDFGLEYHASNSGISDVFLYLLPTALMTGLCFWQLSSMLKDVTPYDLFTAGRSRAADGVRFIMETLQHLLISFSATALVIVTMWVALDQISFIGLLYILILIVGRALSDSWKQLWFPLFWLASLSMLMKYLIQLSTFNTEQSDSGVLFKPGDDSDWVGTIRLDERYQDSEGKPKLWDLLSGEFLIILLCSFQRMAQYFDSSSSARRQLELEELTARFEEQYALYAANNLDSYHPTSSCEVDDDEDDLKDRARAFTYDDEDMAPARSRKAQQTEGNPDNKREDHSHLSSISSDDKDFFSCLRSFGTTYASKASVNVVMLLLTVSCFVHQDIIAMIYLLIVYSTMYAYPATVCRRWWALAWLLSLVIVLEYAVILWLPPFMDIEMEETFPWRVISDTYEKWLMLSNQHKWGLMADFVALLSVYLLPDSDSFTEEEEVITVVDESASALKLTHDSGFIEEGAEGTSKTPYTVSSGEVTYSLLMRKYVWYYLEFVFLANWLPLLLLLVFVFGAKQGGAVSIAYLLGSLVMLYRLDEAREPSNPWIQYLRKWNWAHLFMITVINAPYVFSALSNCLIGKKADDDDSCMSVANFLGVEANKVPYGLIALFVLISIQCEILIAPTYQTVFAILVSEQNRASIRREESVRDFYRRRTEQWYKMKKDKNAAIQRLKIIVSKLVHKVEELMDIALGLHHNLPPMAPSKPIAVERSQNSATISWDKPTNSYHKIRYYRISRQQFPSLTLLGDFGDIVEISGDRCEARIEGLRPGTSYQFKVCAVSRMGEGPFSVASDPIATYPLNLDGTTTAGWMKYRREKLPAPRLGFLVSWMKAKYLHRYVVLDSSHLVFYQDEERALKHRSRKHRKRLKTSFKWRDVISLKLSDSKVQYDDMSPSLYCFEVVVRHAGSRGDVKYVFQSELSKEFNLFLSALAFAVPREALDESIVECLKERNLPNPLDVAPPSRTTDEDPNFDENKSEWSSVTGDESTLGDPEDEEFDDKSGFAWRIPLYRLLYNFQNAGFKLETAQYEEDDLNEPSMHEIVQLVINGHLLLALVICFTVQADLLNMVYVLAVFGFLIVENPRPSPTVWTHLLAYTCCIIALRYVFQLSIFCTGMTNRGYFYPSFEPYCTTATDAATNAKSIQPMVLFGLYKFDGVAIDDVTSGMMRELRLQGFWAEAHSGDIDQASSRYKSEVMRGLRTSFSSSHDSIDDAFLYDGPVTGKKLPVGAGPSLTSQRSSRHFPGVERAATNVSVLSMDNSDIVNEVAAQVLQEMKEQEKLEAEKKAAEAAMAANSNDNVAHSPSSRRSLEYEASAGNLSPSSPKAARDNVVSKQVDMDADESEVGFHARAKESWLEKKYPKAHAYFQTVICKPPAQWDKDIQVAITGEKPGRDFYTASLSVLLFSSVYAVIFYEELGEADSSSTSVADANSRVSSSSLLSGYLVLLVLIELIFIIWDRVAYVTSSLQSKVILQYSYTLVLHMTVWYFLPSNTNIYFQQRPALVAFYLFQCVYLWLGALQIRYGYPAYLGSRYNYTEETKVTEVGEMLFGLMMQAPFLFEMRALLDYMCTKTSLSWQHWVLLEDTAAHLFGVKGDMKGRVENAEILQGKQRQPMKTKLTSAGVMLLFLLICLVGPLAMFSSINPSTTANDVTLTTVVFGIVDEQETMNQLYSNSDSNSPSCKVDLNTESASVQCVEFDVFSYDVWALSPPRMDLLVTQLQSTQALNWTISFTFTRPGPTGDESISTEYSVKMTDEHRNALIPMIKQTVTDDDSTTLSSIQIDSLFPAVVQLTASSGVLQRSTQMRSVGITKHASDGSTWWTIEPVVSSSGSNYCSSAYPFCIVAVSDRIVQGLTTLGISSYGLTAVYIFVVVTVGSAVKGFFRGKLYQIQYEELPDPEDVLELVEGIYIARHEHYVGHLKDEVRIFETLVRVLRSPETLIKVTGTNIIHIPTAKEKLD